MDNLEIRMLFVYFVEMIPLSELFPELFSCDILPVL